MNFFELTIQLKNENTINMGEAILPFLLSAGL
jgi:hypothetical protein